MGLGNDKKILLMGACGMGVGPLGLYLVDCGFVVYGNDDYANPIIKNRLINGGITWVEDLSCFDADVDEIIVSRALSSNENALNELTAQFPTARCVFRGEYLAEIANHTKSIAVAGSHGKTSTTAALVAKFKQSKIPVSYILGGFFEENCPKAANYQEDAEWLVIEVDESDRTIDAFNPDIAVVTNIDLDHTTAYQNEAAVVKAFGEFIVRSKVAAVMDEDSMKKVKSLVDIDEKVLQCLRFGESDGFNVRNEAFANKAFELTGLKELSEHELKCLKVERRQQLERFGEDLVCVQDYAHHPTEITSLLEWSKRYFGSDVHVVFQPHRYSRTKSLLGEFVDCLKEERVTLIPEYAAFEKYDPSASSLSLLEKIEDAGGQIDYAETPDKLLRSIGNTRESKAILFVGAGDISLWYDWIKIRLENPKITLDEHWVSFFQQRCADGSVFRLNEPLKRKVTLHVGGCARFYAEPSSMESLQLLVNVARMLKFDFRIVGKGSNLLIPDGLFDGLFIRFNQAYWKSFQYLEDGRYFARSGVSLKEVCRDALERRIEGFNFLDGIPGSIGGAVRMNAGAMGSELCDRIESIECIGMDGKLKRFAKDELNFQYRGCPDLDDHIILNAIVSGEVLDSNAELEEELNSYRQKRIASQPSEPSAGCMFKNPEGDSAGRLIDHAGLKGFQIGGARISTKHANFLVTERGATANDVEELLKHVHSVILKETGIDLKQEIKRL